MNNLYDQAMTTLYSVWRKRWYGLAAMWAVCLIGWLVIAMIPNQYESSARIYAKWSTILTSRLGSGSDARRQVDVVRQTLTSRPNLEKVIRRSGLDQDIEDDKQLEGVLATLAENIKIEEQDGDLFTLTYTSKNSSLTDRQNATMAQRVVQNLINIFVEENISSDRDNINQAIRFLEDQIALRGRELEEAEKRRADFEIKYLGRLPGGNITGRLMSAQMELDRIDQEMIQARGSLSALAAQLASTPATLQSFEGARYAPGSAQGRIAALEQQIADGYARGWTDQHPDIVTAKTQVNRLRREAGRENGARSGAQTNPAYAALRGMLAERQSALAALGVRRSQVQATIDNMQSQQVAGPEIAAEQAKLNRDYNVLRSQYDELVKQREEVRLRSDVENKTDQVRFQIVDPPSLPRKPVAPNRPLLLTLVLVAGLAAGIATAFVATQIRTTYVTPDKLEESFGIPVVGSVSEVVGDQQRAQSRLWARGFAALSVGLAGTYAALLVYQLVKFGGAA